MKKVLRILLKVLAGILLVFLAALAALQSPKVQTLVGQKVIEKFRENTDADISFNMVSLRPFEAITLDNVSVVDRNPVVEGADTLAYIGSLSAKFSIWGLFGGSGAYVSQARLEDARVQLVTEPDSLAPEGSRICSDT